MLRRPKIAGLVGFCETSAIGSSVILDDTDVMTIEPRLAREDDDVILDAILGGRVSAVRRTSSFPVP